MSAVFFHDHIFKFDQSSVYYSAGKLPYKIWKRYLDVFGSLLVVARYDDLTADSIGGLSISSGPRVDFDCFASNRFLYWRLLKRGSSERIKIRNIVASTDSVIIRLPSRLGHAAAMECRAIGKPYAVEVVGCIYDSYRTYGNILGRISAKYAFSQMKYDVQSASHAIYVTERFLQSRYPCSGITSSASNVELDINPLNRKNECKDGGLTIGFLGDLNLKYKGFSTLFDAFCSIAVEGGIKVFLDVAGSKNFDVFERRARKLGLAECVRFSGVLSKGAQLENWFSRIDVLVCPSLTEGLPRTLVEAMSLGVPCIGSKVGGIPELLSEDCLFDPGDVQGLQSILKIALNSKDWMIYQNNRNIVESRRFNVDLLNEKRKVFWESYLRRESLS